MTPEEAPERELVAAVRGKTVGLISEAICARILFVAAQQMSRAFPVLPAQSPKEEDEEHTVCKFKAPLYARVFEYVALKYTAGVTVPLKEVRE